MNDAVPRTVRSTMFASTELLLDIFHGASEYYRLDLEAIWILAVVGQETMRPWILDPALADTHMTAERVPDSVRGSVSRRVVAFRTGLPRETVRRRIGQLVDRGYLVVDEETGNVRTPGDRPSDIRMHDMLSDLTMSIERFRRRVAELEHGCADSETAQADALCAA